MTAPNRLPPTAPSCEAVRVERFRDPATGWEMIGAGASGECAESGPPLTVEIRFDGESRVDSPVRSAGPGRFEFGLHAPRERNVRLVSVHLKSEQHEQILFASEVNELPDREHPLEPASRSGSRWLSPVQTVGRAVASGELFTHRWWSARVRRYRELAYTTTQRVRDRLLIRSRFRLRPAHDTYIDRTELRAETLGSMQEQVARFTYRPMISILLPVHNVESRWLQEAVESVQRQVYPHWELCIADDASTRRETLVALDRLSGDSRIKIARRTTNGHICAATNTAADFATGEFIALLDHDDLLAPHALFAIVARLQDHPDADLIYSDEDKVDSTEHRYDPQFKPDWSPELLLSYNYINHFTVIRRRLFEQVGRFREGYEGSQDHDLLLRVTERTERIEHIPEILYHWRSLPTSTASSARVKDYVHKSGRKAVAEAIVRRKISASLSVPSFAEALGLPILELEGRDDGPAVAVIVHGKAETAAATIRALKQKTTYPNVTEYLVLEDACPAEALNRQAAGRTEELLLFLEAGLEPSHPSWLSRLVAYATLPNVGAIGGLIRGPDGSLQSAGTVVGTADGRPHDSFRGCRPNPVSYYFLAEVARTVTAPARGCLLTPRLVFERVGGFDAARFAQSLFDVDYSLRLTGLGLRSVHVGGAELIRVTPRDDRRDVPTEIRTLQTAHGLESDRYYNPNLSEEGSFTPRAEAPHLVPALPAEPVPVLFATHTLSTFEGAPKIIQEVATALNRRGIVTASAFAPAPGRAASAYRAAGIPLFATSRPCSQRYLDGQWTPLEYQAAQRQARAVLQQVRPRVVVANTLGMFPLVEAAARCGIPAILAIQESYSESLFERAFSPYGRWRCEQAFSFADQVIFASQSCAGLFRRLDRRHNFEVIHNGIARDSVDEFRRRVTRAGAATSLFGAGAGRFHVVMIGTICERKAQHILIEAAARIARSRPNFACHLVGAREGLPYLSYVRHLIQARGLNDVVTVVPETDRVWDYLRAADCFVCASYVEAFSLSVLEAMAFGLPVISTRCGGLDEQVVWGRSALPFEFGDADELARRLLELIDDPKRRTEMGRQSRAAFELSLTAEEMTERYGRAILSAAGVPRQALTGVSGRPMVLVA